MDSPSASYNDTNEQPQLLNMLNSNLWWLASQPSSLPLPPSAFAAQALSNLSNLSNLAGGLPPELLNSYHQWLANSQHLINFNINAPDFSQYPSIPADSEPQPYPTFDPLAPNLPADDDDPSFKLDMQQPLSFDQLQPLDLSFANTHALAESSSETSPSSTALFSDFGSPRSEQEESPPPEKSSSRRRRRKSSAATAVSTRSRGSSSSTKSRQSVSNVDRIRERNRISAQRFRDKKKADAIDLEMRTHTLSEQRDQLMREITDLQWQSILLQEQCLRKTLCDCDEVKGFFKNKTNLHEKLCHTDLKCHT